MPGGQRDAGADVAARAARRRCADASVALVRAPAALAAVAGAAVRGGDLRHPPRRGGSARADLSPPAMGPGVPLRVHQVRVVLHAVRRRHVRPAHAHGIGRTARAHAGRATGAAHAAARAALSVQRAQHRGLDDPQQPGAGRFDADAVGRAAARHHRPHAQTDLHARRGAQAARGLHRDHVRAFRRPRDAGAAHRPGGARLPCADAVGAAADGKRLPPRRRTVERADAAGAARAAATTIACASRSNKAAAASATGRWAWAWARCASALRHCTARAHKWGSTHCPVAARVPGSNCRR